MKSEFFKSTTEVKKCEIYDLDLGKGIVCPNYYGKGTHLNIQFIHSEESIYPIVTFMKVDDETKQAIITDMFTTEPVEMFKYP